MPEYIKHLYIQKCMYPITSPMGEMPYKQYVTPLNDKLAHTN